VPYAPAPDLPEITGPVETTESGLKYSDIVTGDGPVPAEGQTVSVHYTAWLVNGTRFDSSYEGNRPKQFKLGAGDVIKGWDEGIATMHVGGRRLLVVPPELAYGSQGNGPIPPNAIVIFDVQLISAG
jgi:peptidylprolyl isomerase